MTAILVCGDRNWVDAAFLVETLDQVVAQHGRPAVVITGGANGADALAQKWATQRGYPLIVCQAEWGTHGRAAGPIRNETMLTLLKTYAHPRLAVGFHDAIDQSKGTKHLLGIARRASGVFVTLYSRPTTPSSQPALW